jgi:cytoskeletal protein RodZ
MKLPDVVPSNLTSNATQLPSAASNIVLPPQKQSPSQLYVLIVVLLVLAFLVWELFYFQLPNKNTPFINLGYFPAFTGKMIGCGIQLFC